ncbi:MAG: transposase [Treponema sp.]|nr:transposase [Treponema sp.]
MRNNRSVLGSREAINTEKRTRDCQGISPKIRKRSPDMDSRNVLEAISYVLRTGIQWKAIPKVFVSPSSIYRYFWFWCEQGFFQVLWIAEL